MAFGGQGWAGGFPASIFSRAGIIAAGQSSSRVHHSRRRRGVALSTSTCRSLGVGGGTAMVSARNSGLDCFFSNSSETNVSETKGRQQEIQRCRHNPQECEP